MAARDYLQRFWPYFAIAGMVVILLGASVFIVETLPPRTIVMATGAEGGAYHETVTVKSWRKQVLSCSCCQQPEL